ncbi:tudor domain-containing protein 5-like isoform X2 [Leptopilina heterotoma]|uniref:tudor domain-containing protein 5-like isoform X2 n=1 Tax=Leptopilina heterotoma TaxID=63436 RepID=UPI001CA87B4F|nr:tudor domain-containing protein 5-like isoform X2 [Leptopilina heterotoma]
MPLRPQPTQERRENVESTIRSILISHQNHITIQQLRGDYLEYEGEEIPFREFNHDSLFSFLDSLKHVLTFITKFNKTYIKVIDTEKSRHVREFVEGQKSKRKPLNKFKKSIKSYRGGYYQGSRNSGSLYSSPASRLNNSYSSTSRFNSPSSSTSRFDNFSSASSKTNVENQRSSRLSEMSSEINNSQSTSNEPCHQYFTGEDDYENCDYSDIDEFDYVNNENGKSTPSEVEKKENGRPIIRFVHNTLSSCERFNKSLKDTGLPADVFKESVTYSREHGEDYSLKNANLSHRNSSPKDILQNGRNSEKSPKKHEEIETEQNYEYSSHNGINNNNKNENYASDDGENYCSENTLDINPRLKERLKIIIQNHPEGIWCADLPDIYRKESGLSLEYNEMGFQSVVAFASQLPDIFHCVCPNQRGDYKLFNAKLPVPDLKNPETRCRYSSAEQYRIYDDTPEPIPSRLNPSVLASLYPDGVMLLHERVGQILVDELCIGKHYEEVVLSEVFNPSFFWIQLRKRLPKFKKFMDSLHEFYMEEYKQYQVPAITLDKGLNVACVYAKKWHRGIIKEVLPDGDSLVHFYDYGTIKCYKPQYLYYLHRRFSHLPAQAIPCGLFNVRPINSNKWDKNITWKFIENTSCPLIAQIFKTNEVENSALITLTNTLRDEDFHINDWMVDNKLATSGEVNIDLKNLCDYEETKLPKKCDFDEEDSTSCDTSTQESNVNPRPPPGFQPMDTNSSASVNNKSSKNNTENDNCYQEFLNLHAKMQNQMDGDTYKALLRQLTDGLKITDSTNDGNLKDSTNSKSPDQNDFVNSSKQCDFPKSVEELFSQVPKINENTENQKRFERKNEEFPNIENVKSEEKNLENRQHQENSNQNENHFTQQSQSLSKESEEFLKNLDRAIQQVKGKKNEMKEDRNTEIKETNPFKILEQTEFKPKVSSTNPFINDFNSTNSPKEIVSPRKSARRNLKSFLDLSHDSLSIVNESFESNSSCHSNIFTFENEKQKNVENSHFVNEETFTPSNIFSPVIDSSANQVNNGAKIFYESAPIIYHQTEMENKTDNLDPNYWKPIPSIKTSGPSEPSVKKNGISFKMNKLTPMDRINNMKSPVQMAEENYPKTTIEVATTNENFMKSSINKELLEAGAVPLPVTPNGSRTPTPTEVENMFTPIKTNYQSSSIYGNENIFINQSNAPSLGQRIQEENSASIIHFSPIDKSRNEDIPVVQNNVRPEKNISLNTNPFVGDNKFSYLSKPIEEEKKSTANAEFNSFERPPDTRNIDNSRQTEMRNSSVSPSKDNSLVCYIYPITTKEKSLIVLNVDDEGWLISEEFVEAFMNIQGTSIMLRALNMINVQIPFKTVDRYSHPSLLDQLDFTPLNVIRNVENKIIRPIHLTPLKFAPKILSCLNIINRSEWHQMVHEKKVSSNTIINDIIKLISSYKTYMSMKKRP